MKELFYISVLDYNQSEVFNYKVELEVLETDQKTIEQFLEQQGHELDEISYMFGNEHININQNY